MMKQVNRAVIQHLSEPVCPFTASWRKVHFDDPRVELFIQDNIEAINLKIVGFRFDVFLDSL